MKIRLSSKAGEVILSALVTVALCEISLQVLIRTNTLKIHGMLERPNISKESFADYLKSRNPLTGWPSKLAHGKLFNTQGYRPSPENEKYGSDKACISIFGDSFGYGLDVSDTEAWSNILASKQKCRVENYSVPAYGTDQALLRFEQIKPKSDVVIMTFIDDDMRRNLIQYWDLALGPINLERTKPRFILDADGNLRLIRLPINNFRQAEQLNHWNFGDLFKYESFPPESKIFQTAFRPRFPYTASLAYAALTNTITRYGDHPLVKATLLQRFKDSRSDLSMAIHQTKTLELQRRILIRFSQLCTSAYKKCFILRLQPDFVNPSAEPANPVRRYLEEDKSLSPYFVPGKPMAQCIHDHLVGVGVSPNHLDKRMPGGHYGPETNQAIATCLTQTIKDLGGSRKGMVHAASRDM